MQAPNCGSEPRRWPGAEAEPARACQRFVRRDWWAQLNHGNRYVAVFRWSGAETAWR